MTAQETGVGELELRRYDESDEPAVLELMKRALGWRPEDPNAEFFRWKHRLSPFGISPAWVALDGARVAGFRTFMRWEFSAGGRTHTAVRAVDTATDPDYQGRGIFSRLTRQAVEELRADGVGFVFNTPNDQSRPGYLKMGWQLVGRLPAAARARGVGSVVRMGSARTAANLWSEPCSAGLDPQEAFAAQGPADTAPGVPDTGLRTARTPAYLRWRYGFEPLSYRVMVTAGGVEEGWLAFRVRRRGGACEVVLGDLHAPAGARQAAALLRSTLRATKADYVIGLGGASVLTGMVRLPGQGPLLTWRALAETEMPPPPSWHLTLGDVELF